MSHKTKTNKQKDEEAEQKVKVKVKTFTNQRFFLDLRIYAILDAQSLCYRPLS